LLYFAIFYRSSENNAVLSSKVVDKQADINNDYVEKIQDSDKGSNIEVQPVRSIIYG